MLGQRKLERFLLTLVLVSCLISINCATQKTVFAQEAKSKDYDGAKAQQLRLQRETGQQPEYRIGTAGDANSNEDDAYLREALNYLATKLSPELVGQQQQVPNNEDANVQYVDPQVRLGYLEQRQRSLPSLDAAAAAAYLRTQYPQASDNTFSSFSVSGEKALDSFRQQQQQQQDAKLELDNLDLNLYKLLKDERALQRALELGYGSQDPISRQAADYEVDLSQASERQTRAGNSPTLESSPFFMPDNSRDASSSSKNKIQVQENSIQTNQNHNQLKSSDTTGLGHVEVDLGDSEANDAKLSDATALQTNGKEQSTNNLTTLLEDEEEENKSTGSGPDTKDNAGAKLSQVERKDSRPASYGTVVSSPSEWQGGPGRKDNDAQSIFGKLYNLISYYTPSFIKNLNPLGGYSLTGQVASDSASSLPSGGVRKASPFGAAYPSEVVELQGNDNKAVGSDFGEELGDFSGDFNAKPGVSVAASQASRPVQVRTAEDNQRKSNLNKSNKSDKSNDRKAIDNESMDAEEEVELAKFKGDNQRDQQANNATAIKVDPIKRDQATYRVVPQPSAILVDSPEVEQKLVPGDQLHRVSLTKQSNLVMPLRADDEILMRNPDGTDQDQATSLVGKYLYVPDNRYVFKGPSKVQEVNLVDADEVPMYSPMAHRSNPLQHDVNDVPGDSYIRMKPVYFAHKGGEPSGLALGGKSNDIYFLVMVSAFCLMAVAVVMSAGIFAYRVQQQRKSSNEADYPTYGVVGPNNMSGKCVPGAGSYFTGNLSHNSSHLGTLSGGPGAACKMASGKHLKDMFHPSLEQGLRKGNLRHGQKGARGVATSADSVQGTNGGSNFSVNQNVARMYHYQHQKQQMISSDRASAGRHTSASDLDSEDENDEGSYTVYECPGLASAHEMEIKNPLFNDDRSP